MIAQLLLCSFCFCIGGVSRFCFVGLTAAERRIKMKMVTFLLDFIWGIATVAALMLIIFVFNNGITIVCSSYTPDNRELVIENPQIVNGCQSSYILFNAYKKDLMFTYYNDEKEWNICYNEVIEKWVSRYS